MQSHDIKTRFEKFDLPQTKKQDLSVVITSIKGTPFFKYGIHAYYFLNFKTSRGLLVTIKHKDIIIPGLSRFMKANYKTYGYFPKLRSLFQKYHFNFNFIEQLMLMTVPHTITHINNNRYFINLWSYFGYIDIDCKTRSAKYNILDDEDNDSVLGSRQFYDASSNQLYYPSYSLSDSLKRAVNPCQKVTSKIIKQDIETSSRTELWRGEFVDYLHDIIINKNMQYCVVPELGMYLGENRELTLSRVLILDLKNGKEWEISRFSVAAHAQFDPDDPDIIYFSNHNFQLEHSHILKLLKNASYSVKFRGPASVHKYRLTPDGPVELGVFTEPDLFRLTNFHVFNHRGKNILAAIGSPNYIYIADAEKMKFIRKIEVLHPNRNIPYNLGSICPSPDGEKIFAQTTASFQTIDIATGEAAIILDHSYNHSCANHMITSPDTDW